MIQKIKKCAWCNEDGILVNENNKYWVECINYNCPICHISWPSPFLENTEEKAIKIWNNRGK